MAADSNGVALDGLDGWVIAVVHGITVVGRHVAGSDALEPVYSFVSAMMPNPQGMQIARHVQPLLSYPSLHRIDLPPGAPVWPVALLSRGERSQLAGLVHACEQLCTAMAAAEAGVVLAPAGVKLPPMRRP
jgi:hypothetical protein